MQTQVDRGRASDVIAEASATNLAAFAAVPRHQLRTQRLPFTIPTVCTADELRLALQVRHAGYPTGMRLALPPRWPSRNRRTPLPTAWCCWRKACATAGLWARCASRSTRRSTCASPSNCICPSG